MKRSEQDQLLKEILAGDELSDFRQASLEQGLVAIRRQRRRRRVGRACALASLPFLLVLGIYIRRPPESPTGRIASADPPVTAPPTARAGKSDIKFIND